MICLDTDVLIDCLRGFPNALSWLNTSRSEAFIVPGVVAMELAAGTRDKSDLGRTQKFLGTLTVVWPDSQEFQRAYELLLTHHAATGLSIPDCLVAAAALQRSIPLYTFNTRHFGVIPGLEIIAPYPRG
jgi:predicted nucleic acid-binding protein